MVVAKNICDRDGRYPFSTLFKCEALGSGKQCDRILTADKFQFYTLLPYTYLEPMPPPRQELSPKASVRSSWPLLGHRSRSNGIGNTIALHCVIVYFTIQRRHYFRVGGSDPDGCQETVVKEHGNGSLRVASADLWEIIGHHLFSDARLLHLVN